MRLPRGGDVAPFLGKARSLAQEHRGVVLVLVLGATLRLAVELSRAPAVYQDSLVYIDLSRDAPFSFVATRPNGYPLVVRALSVVGGSLDAVTLAQHVAGLLVGLMVYVMLLRLGTRRSVATVVTALLVFDAYAVALEHDILSETFFTLAITASAYLMLGTGRRPAQIAASGVCLAAATTMRVVGIFAVPFWIVYVLWLRLGRRVTAISVLAVLGPLFAYCAFHAAHGKGFSFTAGDGWYLYGKVGPIVDCSGASIPERTRPLCDGPRGLPPEFYLYDRASPAQVLFFGPTEPVDVDKDWNASNGGLLRRFSIGIIRAQPVEYAAVVLEDLFRYFGPKPASVEMTIHAPPGTLDHVYERWLHLPWWIVTASTLAAVASLLARRPGHRSRPTAFLLGIALCLIVGTSATAGFNPRYLVPVAPLLLAAGALAAEDFVGGGSTGPSPASSRAWRRHLPDMPIR